MRSSEPDSLKRKPVDDLDEKNIRLILAYIGSQYHGWQRQDNVITIQEVIEERLQTMLGAPVKLIASGRTDAGVHAINQVCNFTTQSTIELSISVPPS